MAVPLDKDGLPDVPLMVERGMSITEALEIWAEYNRSRVIPPVAPRLQ